MEREVILRNALNVYGHRAQILVAAEECAFHTQNNGLKCHCSDVELIDPELAENIVKQWAKEHPAKTYAQDFLSKFPKAPKDNYGTPAACRKTIYGGSCIDNADCEDCWNEPMEEDPAHE